MGSWNDGRLANLPKVTTSPDKPSVEELLGVVGCYDFGILPAACHGLREDYIYFSYEGGNCRIEFEGGRSRAEKILLALLDNR